MQSLEVISVNIMQILISLCNLLILFLILKHFLYAPVKKVIGEREEMLKNRFDEADAILKKARMDESYWRKEVENVNNKTECIVKDAMKKANLDRDEIINDAKEKAKNIMRQAKESIDIEKIKSNKELKRNIADISLDLASKLLGRELSEKDQINMIDTFFKENENFYGQDM